MQPQKTLLVVDDDQSLLMLVVNALKTHTDFRILSSTRAQEAMKLAEEYEPELIVSDYYMPEEDGFTFLTKIRSHPKLKGTMFMFLTAALEVQKKVEAFGLGADDYLTKPFAIEELISRAHAMLRLRGLQEELLRDKQELEKLQRELDSTFLSIVAFLNKIIEIKVPNASVRGAWGVNFIKWVAPRFKLSQRESEELQIAAQLHEIGKINLPDELIRKPFTAMNEREREQYVQFPLSSQMIAVGIPRLKHIAHLFRHQLENYDGTGIPDKLLREEIPLGARLLRAINFVGQFELTSVEQRNLALEQIAKARGNALEPRIELLLSEYLQASDAAWIENKRQVDLMDLREGMIIAADICTGNGVKLLSKDFHMTASSIERIRSHHQVDPIIGGVYVYA